MFDLDTIINSSATPTRGAFVSDRTIELVLMSLSLAENRHGWDDMTDTEWDDIDNSIGSAITEILDDTQGSNTVTVSSVKRTTVQSIGSAAAHPIVWNEGDYDTIDNSKLIVPSNGEYILIANLAVSATVARLMNPSIRLNGSENLAVVANIAGTFFSYSMSRQVELDEDDYIQVLLSTNGGNVVITNTILLPNLQLIKLS